MRLRIAALALLLSTIVVFAAMTGRAVADGDGLSGRWKFTFLQDGQPLNFWILDLDSKDGKLSGGVEPTRSGLPAGKINNPTVDGDLLRFALKLENGLELKFEGKLPRAGGKKILGSVQRSGAPLNPGYLEATQAKNAFELKQEMVTRTPSDPRVFATLLELVPLAAKEKVGGRDLQEMVDGVLANAASYGPTFQSEFGVRLVDALQGGYPALAVDTGSKIVKAIDAKGDSRLQLLSAISSSLKKLGRAEEAAKLTAQVDAAEEAAFKEYSAKEFDFQVPAPTVKTTRPALIELFTGAQCPPCVAADIGCDALEKSYGDDTAIVLQYHLHIPGPDPLTAPDNLERAKMYGDSFEGTPAVFFNGRFTVSAGGSREKADKSFRKCSDVVEKVISTPPPVKAKVTASAVRKGDAITIKAEVKDAADSGKMRLHVALTEDWIRYKGSNGVRYHRNVVRAMPGRTAGYVVDPKGFEKELTIDVAKLRTDLIASLQAYADKEDAVFPHGFGAMRLQDLHVVAFLQSDDTGEILAAIRTPVKTEAK